MAVGSGVSQESSELVYLRIEEPRVCGSKLKDSATCESGVVG